MLSLLLRFIRHNQGAETIEYALVDGFLAIAAVGAIAALGTSLATYWGSISTSITAAF